MKTILKTITILILLLTTACSSNRGLKSIEKTDVNLVFSKVYKATQEAILSADMEGLELESIDLTFATTDTYSKEAGFNLWVISGAYSKSKSTAKTTTFSFGKAEEISKSMTEDKSIKVLKEYLISVINSAKKIKNIDKFGLKEFSAEVEFTINSSLEGGVEIELSPVTPSLGKSKEKQISHTITLNFKTKK